MINDLKRIKELRYILYSIKRKIESKEEFTEVQQIVKDEVELLDRFDGWGNFAVTWDVYYVGWKVYEMSKGNIKAEPLVCYHPNRIFIKPVTLVIKEGQHYRETDDQMRIRLALKPPIGAPPMDENELAIANSIGKPESVEKAKSEISQEFLEQLANLLKDKLG